MQLNDAFITTLLLTFKLATISTFCLLFVSIALAYCFVFVRLPFKSFFQALVSMPLVLPPSVLGFYLLVSFSPKNALGAFLQETFGLTLVFSFEGLVVASMIVNLPFMTNPIQSAFSSVSRNLIDASYTLGHGKLRTLWSVILPNAKAGILTGLVMPFAHTCGEFGVVMMIGGHKVGETLVASIAIYDSIEALEYTLAHQYAFVLFALSFCVVFSLYLINKRFATANAAL